MTQSYSLALIFYFFLETSHSSCPSFQMHSCNAPSKFPCYTISELRRVLLCCTNDTLCPSKNILEKAGSYDNATCMLNI